SVFLDHRMSPCAERGPHIRERPVLSPGLLGPPSPPPTTWVRSAAVSSSLSGAGVGVSWGAMVTSLSCLWDWCIGRLLLPFLRPRKLPDGIIRVNGATDDQGQLDGGQFV